MLITSHSALKFLILVLSDVELNRVKTVIRLIFFFAAKFAKKAQFSTLKLQKLLEAISKKLFVCFAIPAVSARKITVSRRDRKERTENY